MFSVGVPSRSSKPESQDDHKGSSLPPGSSRCFSNAASLHPLPYHPRRRTPVAQQCPVIYREMPKDNPNTRFSIPMLRNDISSQYHRFSFTDFVVDALQCDFSLFTLPDVGYIFKHSFCHASYRYVSYIHTHTRIYI